MMDCGGVFSLQTAARLIQELQPLGMLFVEEPLNMDTPRDLATLRRTFPGVRIAAGERQLTRWGFREWLEQEAVDVIQADVCHCGGISELIRIANMAEIWNVQIAPHNPYGPVAMAANMHAAAVIQNFLILEHCRQRPWFDDVQIYGPEVREGCLLLNQRPGLGVELDWDFLSRHSYKRMPLRTFQDPYGGMPCV
jgi:galactonate dehydratase